MGFAVAGRYHSCITLSTSHTGRKKRQHDTAHLHSYQSYCFQLQDVLASSPWKLLPQSCSQMNVTAYLAIAGFYHAIPTPDLIQIKIWWGEQDVLPLAVRSLHQYQVWDWGNIPTIRTYNCILERAMRYFKTFSGMWSWLLVIVLVCWSSWFSRTNSHNN